MKTFENVELNQTVTFEKNGMIETGVVENVTSNKFSLRVLAVWRDEKGVIGCGDRYYCFFKTGTKGHNKSNHGNAIAITGRI